MHKALGRSLSHGAIGRWTQGGGREARLHGAAVKSLSPWALLAGWGSQGGH